MNIKKIICALVCAVLAQGLAWNSFAASKEGACRCQCAKHHICHCSKCSDCKK